MYDSLSPAIQATNLSRSTPLPTFKMKFILIALTLAATAIAGDSGEGKVCKSGQSVVCSGNGNGGLLTLGNVAPGALGESCAGGDVYCCDDKDVAVSAHNVILKLIYNLLIISIER